MTTPEHNRTIVIADDEAPIRMVVGQKLRSAGYVVFEASDGEEALALIRLHRPLCFISDLQMPFMNGFELCCAVKAEPAISQIPALLLTARGHVLSNDMLAATNIQRVMSKPFGVRDLLTYVESTLVPAGLKMRTAPTASGASRAA